ncbi:MAG: YkvA family protein [Polyangiaceae bacterium]|nr:YkvA family protein [Polyangiaceae bacterium]
MTIDQTPFLDAFPTWLKSLPEDVRGLADMLGREGLDQGSAQQLAGALNYLFRSLDLIPDGIEDLGFVDDAFVLRVAAADLVGDMLGSEELVEKLAAEAQVIREFLQDDYAKLEAFVAGLGSMAVRGRSVEAIVAESGVRDEFCAELKSWADTFSPPSFTRDPRTLTKLRAFLHAKLAKQG